MSDICHFGQDEASVLSFPLTSSAAGGQGCNRRSYLHAMVEVMALEQEYYTLAREARLATGMAACL